MKNITALLTLSLVLAAPLRADITPADAKKSANEKIGTIQKNTQDAKTKLTTEASPTPAKKKRKGFFEGELSKDRSQPAAVKSPTPEPKPTDPPYKSLGSELRKKRG